MAATKQLPQKLRGRAEKALAEFEKYLEEQRHGKSGDFNFGIKIQKVDVPDWVREKLSENEIEDIYAEQQQRELEAFMEELPSDYPWIQEVTQEGRMGGWLVVSPGTDWVMDLRNILDGPYYMDDDSWVDDAAITIKSAEDVLKDVVAIDTLVRDSKRSFVQYVESDDFWKQYTEE